MDLPYLTPLRGPDLAAVGIPAPWSFGIADRVRFGELDALGHVNHTAYLRWFESFRLPYLADRQVTDYSETSPRLVLAEIQCRYLAEMGLNDTYIVTGRIARLGRSSFTMAYAVWTLGDHGPLQTADATAVLVLRTRDGTQKFPIPDNALARIAEAEGVTR